MPKPNGGTGSICFHLCRYFLNKFPKGIIVTGTSQKDLRQVGILGI
jgi:FlaA1/EpsC-like NDP-sugar epimerase